MKVGTYFRQRTPTPLSRPCDAVYASAIHNEMKTRILRHIASYVTFINQVCLKQTCAAIEATDLNL